MNRFSQTLSALISACLLTVGGCSGVADSHGAAESTTTREQSKPPFDPALTRVVKPSKSLTLAPDWQPPAPTRTQQVPVKARVKPASHWGIAKRILGPKSSDAEIRAASFTQEPLRPVPGTSTAIETGALAAALHEDAKDDRQFDAIEDFLEAHPASRWAPVLHLNLGTVSFEKGYFQSALAHWKAAWDLAKGGEDGVSRDIANLALAESAKMNGRIGRVTELEALLAEAQKRTLTGDARVKIGSASEGAWMMRHQPGVSFMCGPYALLNVAREQKRDVAKKTEAFLEKHQSPTTGFSIPEVQRMSAELGLKLQIAKREVGAPIITPSVVHWKLGHFAALVREVDGRFLLEDPTFGHDTFVTAKAIDREASGYFLVPAGPLPSGWSAATTAETAQLYGKGFTSEIADATGPWDHKVGGNCQSLGKAMASYQFHTLAASLHIEDTPIGYSPAFGSDVRVNVLYNQRRASQPTALGYTNFGPQFDSNWTNFYIAPITNVMTVYTSGGSYLVMTHVPGVYPGNRQRGETFEETGVHVGKSVFPDGSEEYYEHIDENSGVAFLSRTRDAQGNETTIQYDVNYQTRIDQIIDATGLPTVFHYDYVGEPYLVTSIEDPFGRTATFTYAWTAGNVRLQSIEDVQGIVSSFTYSDGGEIASMTTPYGTTTFNLSAPYVHTGESMFRYVEATDPLGQTERVEFNISPSTGVLSALEAPQPDGTKVNYSPAYNNYRNTFYWDKLLTKVAPGDYQKAHLYHWLHMADMNVAAPILESERPSLEGRIFYNYAGQFGPTRVGETGFPSVIGRVVKDASGSYQTQASQFTYNPHSNVTRVTDPLGRQTELDYDANDIDLQYVKQKTGAATYATTAAYTYGGVGAPPHRPMTATDGAGNTTAFTYTSKGQIATITNAKNEATQFAYDTDAGSPTYGRLVSITGDVPGGNRTFTYDAYGHVRTTTDSDGYVLTFDYDLLDRVRTVTYPDGTYEQHEYDDHSLSATRDRQGRWTRHLYNPLLERVLTQDPALRTTQFQWCRCGELRRFVDANGAVTEWARDAGRHVTRKINPNGSFDSYQYDLSGRLSTAIDATTRTTTFKYALDDRLLTKDYSDTSTPDVTCAYDSAYPRLKSRVDGAGTTTFTYYPDGAGASGAGQLATVNGPLADDTQKYTYDALGRLKKSEIVSDATPPVASYSEEYTFDARGRVTTVANNLGSTTYGFLGQSGRPSSVEYANGMKTQFDYTAATGDFMLKQIKNVTSGATPTVISQFDYTYGADRSVATWKVEQGSGAKTWTFGYDEARQLTSATLRDASSAVLESNTYGYDNAGNRIQVGNGTTAPKNYETNNLNQLLTERDYGKTTFAGFVDEPATVKVNGQPAKVMSTDGGAPFKFEAPVTLDAGANTVVVEAKDGRNNTSTKTYSVTTTGASKTYEYDANGNLRFEKLPNGTVVREFRWDQQNRLVKELHGTHESAYEYDGASRRWRITEKENGTQTKQETFVWCGSRICQKRNGATVVRSYFGQGFEENGTTDYFYTRDHLGSVREVVGSDGTTVASRLSYDTWGKVTETGSGTVSDYTYTGHQFDRPTGLSLARYRAYDPNLGRWLSRDPIGIRGGVNLYGYANDDPVSYIDMDGHVPVWVLFAGVAAYALYLSFNSPTHDGSVVAGAPIMVAPAAGWAVGDFLGGMCAGGSLAPSTVTATTLTGAVGSQDAANRVNAALRGRIAVESLTPDERAAAAQFYRDVSMRVVGNKADAAEKFNLERAAFLEGETDVVPGTIYDSIKRNGGK